MAKQYILKAAIQDVPQINNLINNAYRGELSKKGWTNEIGIIEGSRMDEMEVARMIEGGAGSLFKSVNEKGEVIGCVYLEIQGDQLYLGSLTVSPDIQAQGIGKMMLQYADAYARANDCPAILMTVVSGRDELINWYLRHGYQLTGESKPFPTENRFGTPLKSIQLVVLKKLLFLTAPANP